MAVIASKSMAPMVERLIRERQAVSVRLKDGLEFCGMFVEIRGPKPLAVYFQEKGIAGKVGFFVAAIEMIEADATP